jgi:hypothetical protein
MNRSGIPFPSAVAALLLAAPAPLLAATPPTESQADAIILKPLSLIKKKDMDFGTLITSSASGTATIDPVTGAVTTAGGVIEVPGSPTSAGIFMGAGSRNAPYQIRIPSKPMTLTRSGGTETMTVTNWTLDGPTNRKIGANEAFQFGVGAQLTVAANQAPGTYVGTFDVTVHYP